MPVVSPPDDSFLFQLLCVDQSLRITSSVSSYVNDESASMFHGREI